MAFCMTLFVLQPRHDLMMSVDMNVVVASLIVWDSSRHGSILSTALSCGYGRGSRWFHRTADHSPAEGELPTTSTDEGTDDTLN